MTLKTTKIFDLNLFSGSSELLRQSAGAYFSTNSNSQIYFTEANSDISTFVTSAEEGESIVVSDSLSKKLIYPTRLSILDKNTFLSDDEWKAFLIGGDFGSKTYPGLYNELVYADHSNAASLPYRPRELVNTDRAPSLTLTTEYFNYYSRYQTDVDLLQSELQAPNIYLLQSGMLNYDDSVTSPMGTGEYPAIKEFLTNTFVNSEKTIDEKQKNLFVVNNNVLQEAILNREETAAMDGVTTFDDDLIKKYSLMPYGIKFSIDRALTTNSPNRDYRNIIEKNNYQIKLLKLLKETFQKEISLTPSVINFGVNTDSVISNGTYETDVAKTETQPFQIIDAPAMFLYGYRNYLSETNDAMVLSSSSDDFKFINGMVFDLTGTHRYRYSSNNISMFNGIIGAMNSKFESSEQDINTIDKFLNQAGESKYYETLAYRVQKIGGQPTGDSNTENTIQNIWFYNSGDAIDYLDTQVKYDTEYTYKAFKYDIVQGYKYQLSDVTTTRQIAVTASGNNELHCLEFYDPFTGQARNNLLNDTYASEEYKNYLTRRISKLKQWRDILQADKVRAEDFIGLTLPAVALRRVRILTNSDNFIVLDNSSSPTYRDMLDDGSGGGTDGAYPYYTLSRLLSDDELTEIDTIGYQGYFYGQEAIEIYKTYTGLFTGRLLFSEYKDTLEITTAEDDTLLEPKAQAQLTIDTITPILDSVTGLLSSEQTLLDSIENTNTTQAQLSSLYAYLADFNINIEPSLKIIEIPLEEKRMRIVDHPPNDFVVTPHHFLDQSNRLAFYCKYDTFSMKAVTYPPTLTARDELNREAYLTGNDFIDSSEQTQESVSRARFLEVYRTTDKPTSYRSFSGTLRETIDLRQSNGDIVTDHLFVERVRENITYYYAFRAVNENGVAGQMSPVFESELINDGGYTYGRFEQHLEEDLAEPKPKEPLSAVKKLLNIIPNIQHLELDTSRASFADPSSTAIDNISLGSNVSDPLFSDDTNRYFKIRLTSKKTGRKLDINIGFKKEVRK